jgi:hypothetical protein
VRLNSMPMMLSPRSQSSACQRVVTEFVMVSSPDR